MNRIAAVTAMFAALGTIWASSATGDNLPMTKGPAKPFCEAYGGTFVLINESMYACNVSLETLRSEQLVAAFRICENVYGGRRLSMRFAYYCIRE